MSTKETKILGTKLSILTKEELEKLISEFLSDKKGHYIVTPNPEIVLMAEKDPEYQAVLNGADISIADGFGLVLAGWLRGIKIPRHTGSGLTPEILKEAEERRLRVMVINLAGGWSPAPEIKTALKKYYPQLALEAIDIKKENNLTKEHQKEITDFAPDIVFTTVGIPIQEKIIGKYLGTWRSVK